MKYIKLTQRKIALIDDIDYDWLNQHKWCAQKTKGNFYAVRNSPKIKGKSHQIFMHRIILGLEYKDGLEGDHKNHDTLDNRRNNLRICTHQQNIMNQSLQKNKTSRYKGVCWATQKQKWQASIKINGVTKFLGRFTSEKEAALAYDKAAIKYFGEYAYLNVLA